MLLVKIWSFVLCLVSRLKTTSRFGRRVAGSQQVARDGATTPDCCLSRAPYRRSSCLRAAIDAAVTPPGPGGPRGAARRRSSTGQPRSSPSLSVKSFLSLCGAWPCPCSPRERRSRMQGVCGNLRAAFDSLLTPRSPLLR